MASSEIDVSIDKSAVSSKRRTIRDFEFLEIDSKYGKTSIQGKGAYGCVKKVRMKENGKVFAMKIVIFCI